MEEHTCDMFISECCGAYGPTDGIINGYMTNNDLMKAAKTNLDFIGNPLGNISWYTSTTIGNDGLPLINYYCGHCHNYTSFVCEECEEGIQDAS